MALAVPVRENRGILRCLLCNWDSWNARRCIISFQRFTDIKSSSCPSIEQFTLGVDEGMYVITCWSEFNSGEFYFFPGFFTFIACLFLMFAFSAIMRSSCCKLPYKRWVCSRNIAQQIRGAKFEFKNLWTRKCGTFSMGAFHSTKFSGLKLRVFHAMNGTVFFGSLD